MALRNKSLSRPPESGESFFLRKIQYLFALASLVRTLPTLDFNMF